VYRAGHFRTFDLSFSLSVGDFSPMKSPQNYSRVLSYSRGRFAVQLEPKRRRGSGVLTAGSERREAEVSLASCRQVLLEGGNWK
jgi:hypothetical protein